MGAGATDVPPDPEEEARSSAVGPSRPRLLGVLGPGLITGASDDDPVAIGTYAQAGAAFGYALCWLPLLCWPLMAVVQEMSGRIGRTTGRGLAGAIGRHYPRPLLWGCVLLILFANTVALGADLGAMGDALSLLIGGPRLLYVVLFAALCIGMQVFLRYTRYVAILKWTTLSLLAYFAAAALAGVEWGEVARGLVPSLSADEAWITAVVAIFGVALSPFLLFWQSAQEVEDQRVHAAPRAAAAGAGAGAGGAGAHPAGHGHRHGRRGAGGPRHHGHDRGDPARRGRHRHRQLGAGGRGAAARRRRLRLCAVRARHHRHRAAGGAGAGRLGRLRDRRGAALAGRPVARTAGGEGLLRHPRRRHRARAPPSTSPAWTRSGRCSGARWSTASSPRPCSRSPCWWRRAGRRWATSPSARPCAPRAGARSRCSRPAPARCCSSPSGTASP